MANTYVAIATVTVGSGGASTITFSSIPGTYTDLLLKYSLRNNSGDIYSNAYLSFNGSPANFNMLLLQGDGSIVSSASATAYYWNFNTGGGATSNTFANGEYYIPNYTSTNNKSISLDVVTENNGTTALNAMVAKLYTSSSAITSITMTAYGSSTFNQYSSATLYGIKNS